MKKYSKYIECVIILVLSLIPCVVFAAAPTSLFTPTNADMSVFYLSKIFGTVPGVPLLSSGGQTIIGSIFGVFNSGVLGISGMFLGYTTFKLVTETTMDGASMAKSATMWTAARVGASTALLVPGASGYSLINTVVMWLVIQSIGLADATWNNALEFLSKGAPLTAQPVSATIDYSLIDPTVLTDNSNINSITKQYHSGAADILRALVCSYTIQNALNAILSGTSTNSTSFSKRVSTADFMPYRDSSGDSVPQLDTNNPSATYPSGVGMYQFPYVKNTSGDSDGAFLNSKYTNSSGQPINVPSVSITGICGTISYITPFDQSLTNYTTNSNIYTPAKQQGLQSMIAILDPIAQQLVAQAKPQPEKSSLQQLDPGNYVLKDAVKYADVSVGKVYFSAVAPTSWENRLLSGVNQLTYRSFYTGCSVDNLACDQKSINAQAVVGINWPFGAMEMLNAAAAYQVSVLAAAQSAASPAESSINFIYKQAKEKGWIIAGSYYTLLEQANSTAVAANYDFYKLVGYKGAGTSPMKLYHPEPDRSKMFGYTPFFNTSDGSDITNLLVALDRVASTTNSDSVKILNRSLLWLYFTVPYSKILGMSLYQPSLPQQKIDAVPVPNTSDESNIYLQLGVGAVLMPFPFLAAVATPILAPIPLQFLSYDIGMIMVKWNDLMGGGAGISDPIVKLQLLGQQMICSSASFLYQIQMFFIVTTVANVIVSSVLSVVTLALGSGSFWGITTGATIGMQNMAHLAGVYSEMAHTIISMYLPIGLALIGPLMLTGIILAIYVPLIPYMLFLFGVMSWFISVIVMMAAAPIICFLMIWGAASQENPLLSKEAEQFITQMLSVFFRPTLMVIGLIVGVVLARIGVDVLNLGFQTVLNNVFNSGPAQTNNALASNSLIIMLQQVGAVVIYTFIMMSLVNICFSTIHVLHSEVMGVVGMRVVGAGVEEKALGEVKAGVQQFAEAGVSGAKESATSLKSIGPMKSGSFQAKDKDDKGKGATAKASDNPSS